jgi:spore germination protein KA
MLRRKIKSPDLMFDSLKIGVRTKTDVCIAYINGLADPKLIEEIKRRLDRIKTDAILESGYIEQFIEDEPYSIFPMIANSEKPDKVAAKLLEGRAAILVDGTPFVLTAPALFIESFQAAEDYYSRPYFASLIRLLRYVSYFISILAPGLYVAISTFHQELIPTDLLLTMAAAHEGVPFPSVLEAAIMIIMFEILREAGVRLPRPIGSAVSIVGALVIGEAAVSAGLIGAPMVIVVAITAVSSFVVPAQTDSGAILRYGFLILAGFMGGFGIAIGLLAVLFYMASLKSFGVPYLSSLAPFNASDMKDVFIRAPIWEMNKRPKDIPCQDAAQFSGKANFAKSSNGAGLLTC